MTLFPTEQWLDAYGRRLDQNEVLDEVADGWGVGFDGTVRLVIEDIPLAETTLADLPDDVLADIPTSVREGVGDVTLAEAPEQFGEIIRPALPERPRDLVRQIEENIKGRTVHAQIDLREGGVVGTEVLDDPDAGEAGVVIRGPLTTWQQVLDGRPTLSALLAGDLAVETAPVRLVRYSTMLQQLGTIAADLETTHLFAVHREPSSNGFLDAVAGSSAALQRSAERRVRQALRDRSLR